MRIPTPLVRVTLAALVVAGCSVGEAATPTTTTTARLTRPTITTTTTTRPDPASFLALTGLEPDSEEQRTRPVVVVKIDNVQGRGTPQAGINQADVIYEIPVEGNVTRLMALFHSQDAAPVGPVRSARASEIVLLEELNHPVFAWHGANQILGPLVEAADIENRSIDRAQELYYRERSRRAPYNSMIVGTAELRATAPEGAANPGPLFVYRRFPSDVPSATARPAQHVRIHFPNPFGQAYAEAPADFSWDGEQWRRAQSDQPHLDEAGAQVAVENVIVRFTPAIASGTVDRGGATVPTAELVGSGPAWVFTDGQVIEGTWVNDPDPAPTRYLDAAGDDILLTPGRTWVALPYGEGSWFE